MLLYNHKEQNKRRNTKMTNYNIYNMQTDELIGTVKADNINEAEYKATGKFTEYNSNEMYALKAE